MAGKSDDGDLNELHDENLRLKAAVEELSILNEISTAINSALSLEKIIELIVRKCVKYLCAEQGTVTILERRERENPFVTMVRGSDRSTGILPLHLDTQITGWMLANREPLVIDDLGSDKRFKSVTQEDNPVKSLLSVPLLLKGTIMGSLNVFNKRGKTGFTESDKRLLSIIATQSAQVIENARLLEEEKALIYMREEMEMACRIQMGLLPARPPELKGYDIAGKSIPARTVGGDYFDFISLEDDRVVCCLGDVSGKGMPAALLMSNLQATFRGQDLANHRPEKIMQRSNLLLFRSTDPEKFATFFFGILDGRRHTFEYCNAGHNHPIVSCGRESRRLEKSGLILGAIEEAKYESGMVEMVEGDVLTIFSDGISEAVDADDAEFSEERICGVVSGCRDLPAAGIIDRIVSEVRRFAGDLPQRDDMTLVVVKRAAGA